MRYVGSKSRHAAEIAAILTAARRPSQPYYEPFLGMAHVLGRMAPPKYGSDLCAPAIAYLKALQKGWLPPATLPEADWRQIRDNQSHYPPELVAFAGFGCSFGGKWFGGYARGTTTNGTPRNYAAEAHRFAKKMEPGLQEATLRTGAYNRQPYQPESLIYCDPPYTGTQSYGGIQPFDHPEFWTWCNTMVAKGHKVFVSEFQAPPEWVSVWSKSRASSLDLNTGGKTSVEHLFTKNP